MPAEKQRKPGGLTDEERQAYWEARNALDAQDVAMKSGNLPKPESERPAADIVRELKDGVASSTARRRGEKMVDRPHIQIGGSFENPMREPDGFERWLGDLVKKVGQVFRWGKD